MSCRNSAVAAWLAATLLLAGCHPAPRATAPAAAPLPPLQHDIDAVIDAAPFAHAYWAALVRSLDRHDTIYARNADRLLIPASSMKVVTLAVSAARLGWNYRYETRLEAPAPDRAGVIGGDLVVVGSGDPSIGDRIGTNLFAEWVAALKARGIVRIDGRIVADSAGFADPLGSGWAWDDLGQGYAAPVTALQLNENSLRVSVAPGAREGDAAIVTAIPPGSGVAIDNAIVTGATGTTAFVQEWPSGDFRGIRLSGTVPLGGDAVARTIAVPDPALFFATELRRALIAGGVDVRGPAVVERSPTRHAVDVVLTATSAPLSTLAMRLMKSSQNLYAETLLRTLGGGNGPATAEAGKAIVQRTIASWGAPAGEIVVGDGSGLSRYNLVTPATLVTILEHVDGDAQLRDPFVASLPIAGRDGTLAGRMKGTAAEGNARVKTGSMTGVRTATGYVRTSDGERLAFAILANNYEIGGDEADAAIDAVIVRLASFSRKTKTLNPEPRTSSENQAP